MLDNKKLLALAIIVSLAGVLALFFYASSIEPAEISLADIGEDDVGSLVMLNGTVRSFRVLDDGSASFMVVDIEANSSLVVYVRGEAYIGWTERELAIPGAQIEAVGIIEVYNDIYELVVNSAEEIRLLREAGTDIIPVGQLLNSKDIFEDMIVKTNGTMKNPYFFDGGMGFELMQKFENKSYRLDCILFAEEIVSDYDIDDELEVTGTFKYYAPSGSWQLEIEDEGAIKLTT